MSVIVENSTIVLSGTVGDMYWDDSFSAAEVSLALAQVGHANDVTIRLNSGGGIASEGAAIHAAIARHAGRKTIVVEGIAASAAFTVAMAGDDIIATPGSVMMMHDPSGFTFGTVSDHEVQIRALTAIAASMAGIYAARSGDDLDTVRADMISELWLTPEEAVARGYADRVGNDVAAGSGAEIIQFPEREPAPFAYAQYQHAPEPLRALASANGWGAKPRPSQAANPVVPQRQEPIMTTTPQGGGQSTAPKDPTTNVVDLDTARSTARTEALVYARAVNELCALAGHADRATAFIEKETSLDDVRTSLVDIKAQDAAKANITSQQAPKQARFSLASNMRGRLGQKEA